MKAKYLKFIVVSLLAFGGFSTAFAERPEPQRQLDAFFRLLKEQTPQEAVDSLIEGTTLKRMSGAQIAAVIPQFEAALKIYGKLVRVEPVDEKNFGTSFVRYRMISYHAEGLPLFWSIAFFRGKEGWEVHVFRFYDKFEQVFGD